MCISGIEQCNAGVDFAHKTFVLFPQDQVEVEVVVLTAIRIRAPITRMETGAQV